MRRYWYRRNLIRVLVLTIYVGGSWSLKEESRAGQEREASEAASEELTITGGLPVGTGVQAQSDLYRAS